LDVFLVIAQSTSEMDPLTRNVSNVISIGLSAWLVIYFITKVQPRWEKWLDARDTAAEIEREKFYANAKEEREAQEARHARDQAVASTALTELVSLTRAIHNDVKTGTVCRHPRETA